MFRIFHNKSNQECVVRIGVETCGCTLPAQTVRLIKRLTVKLLKRQVKVRLIGFIRRKRTNKTCSGWPKLFRRIVLAVELEADNDSDEDGKWQ
jgi:hypothetical protein